MKNSAARTSGLLATLALLITGCGGTNTGTTTATNTSATLTSTAIPIGIAFAQTSNVALLGQELTAGAKIAEKYFNDKGGINGTPIKLVFQDTGEMKLEQSMPFKP